MVVVKKNDTETKINLQKLKKVVDETINDKNPRPAAAWSGHAHNMYNPFKDLLNK